MGFVILAMGGRILAVYDIMGYEGALFDPPSGAFLVLVECVVEPCVCASRPCVLSITVMGSVYLTFVVLP